MSSMDEYSSRPRSGGLVKKALLLMFLAIAAIVGHYFYTEHKEKQEAAAAAEAESQEAQADSESGEKSGDSSGSTTPAGMKRLREMEETSTLLTP
jgi:hypothetical protein